MFPLSVKNTTIFSTSRKQKMEQRSWKYYETLNNISSVSQEYCNVFNLKEPKETNNAARVINNAEEHFLCQSKMLQPF